MLQVASKLEGDAGFGGRLSRLPEAAIWCLFAPELWLDIDTENDAQTAIARGLLDDGN